MHQLLVTISCLAAGLSAGCSIGFPGVLIEQLAANDSSIVVDLNTASWIGSIHGLAGIPSIVMPAFMQCKGRKLGFIISCLVGLAGWLLVYSANSARTLLISEFINGFGSHCVLVVAVISLSEMLSPQYRNVLLVTYYVLQTFSFSLVQIVGKYLHWRTLSLVINVPVLSLAILTALMWPESPYWLACKGRFEECEKAFTRLRGPSDFAKLELEELIAAQRENLACDKYQNQALLKYFWQKIASRNFYMPVLHINVLMSMANWSGYMVIIIYASKIIMKATQSKNAVFWGGIILNCAMFLCYLSHMLLIRFFNQTKVLMMSTWFTIACLLAAASVNYCQTIGVISEESHIFFYVLVVYIIAISLGILPVTYSKATEIVPVRHRDIGIPVVLVCSCISDASALKLAPYFFKYINLWGTMLLYAVNLIICGLFVFKYVPETKGKTLQQLEDYYTYGGFDKHRRRHSEKCATQLNEGS